MRSILVIRFSSLGDVILSTPIVRQLQRTYPDVMLDVATSSRFHEVYQHNPRVRTAWSVDPAPTADSEMDDVKLSMKESLPDGEYDLIVDLQSNVRSAAFRHNLGSTVVRAPKHRMEKLALVWLKKRPAVITPIVARYRSTIEHLPLALDTDGPEVWLPTERVDGVYGPSSRLVRPLPTSDLHVAVAPGAQHATKRWPVAKVAALCERLLREGARVTLIGGPADVPICDAIAAAVGGAVDRADGATSLAQTIAVLDRANVLVSMDSGAMHLGAARQVPTVAIFGSTVKELGFAPYGVRHQIVDHDVRCRPCSHIGRSKCPKGHFLCMEGIDVEQVLAAIRKLTA
ncbi:MAG: glycosyltransferase family 9 protein [Ignavibacteriae bacterium]|nr:MAG: glycosyltransferase family 9 protein [Ignavibacteriota bacterium]